MLGEMIGEVKFARDVFHAKLSLFDAMNEPEEPHVHTFRPLGIDAAISETHCHSVVHA